MLIYNLKNSESLDKPYKNEIIELIHFIRTPLASIKIGSEILNDVFPILVKSYKANLKHNERGSAAISEDKLNKLTSIFEGLIVEANRISEYMHKMEIK